MRKSHLPLDKFYQETPQTITLYTSKGYNCDMGVFVSLLIVGGMGLLLLDRLLSLILLKVAPYFETFQILSRQL